MPGMPIAATSLRGGGLHTGGPWYGYSGWDDYAARNGITCTPGTVVKFDDGLMHVCQ